VDDNRVCIVYFVFDRIIMIKGITGGKYISVSGGYASDPYISPGSSGAGMLRWNSNMNCLEVNDGVTWKQFSTAFPTIDLTPEATELLDWARKKMLEERRIDELCKKYPGLDKARANYETFLAMVESETSV
jgi:hypothetical protein